MCKKYLNLFSIMFLFVTLLCGCAKNDSVNFDNQNYKLQFSNKSPLTNGYINEYIKPNENVQNWTEMVGVYHYPSPRTPSPVGFAKEFAVLVKTANKDAGVSVMNNKKEDVGVIDFLTWAPTKETGKIKYLEFNVFKFKKYGNHGLIALQYARRYPTKDIKSSKNFAQTVKADRIKYLQLVIKQPIPQIVNENIQVQSK